MSNGNDKTGWFVHAEFVVIFISLLGGFYMLRGEIMHVDNKIDQQAMYMNNRIDQVNCRMDQFQIMFYDLLKEQKAK